MSVTVIDRLHSVDISENKYRLLVLSLIRDYVIVQYLLTSHAVIHAGKGIGHIDLLKFLIFADGENMTAHTEKLGIHILDEHAEIKIVKKLRLILNGYVSDDEVKIVHRSKYIEIGFAFLVNIVRIKFS